MKKMTLAAWLLLAMFGGISFAHGQKETERYIPIGQSPGQSGKTTVIGAIQAVDTSARAITVDARKVIITDKTDIWVDRSRLKLTTLRGRFADLQSGRRAEIKVDPKAGGMAEWVKVETPAP